MAPLLALVCDMDACCQALEPVSSRRVRHVGPRQRTRQTTLALSEMLTLLVYFPWSHDRTFTHYYTEYVMAHLPPYFPQLVGSQRLVERLPRALVPLGCSLSPRTGRCTGIAVMDSTPLAVCDKPRLATPKGFAGLARRGKTSRGWVCGFTLHRLVHDAGALLAWRLTPGQVNDRQPGKRLTAGLGGERWGDRGSLSQALPDVLLRQGLELLTKIRKNMKHRLMRLWDKLLLRKRSLIETIKDQLKNRSQIEHTRHRSVAGFMVHLVAGLVAYSYRPKKPSLGLRDDSSLPVLVI
jgi:hypothetical protein